MSKIYKDKEDAIIDVESTFTSETKREASKFVMNFTPEHPGILICSAKNQLGQSTAQGKVIINDMKNPLMISGLIRTQKIAEGDSVILECAASVYDYSKIIFWTKYRVDVEKIDGIHLESMTTTKYSHRQAIFWKNITKKFNGIYQCGVYRRDDIRIIYRQSVSIEVHDAEAPMIITNINQPTTIIKSSYDSLDIECNATGLPIPSLTWYKNDKEFHDRANLKRRDIIMRRDRSFVKFEHLKPEDSGVYRCVATNRISSYQKEFELIVEGNLVIFYQL